MHHALLFGIKVQGQGTFAEVEGSVVRRLHAALLIPAFVRARVEIIVHLIVRPELAVFHCSAVYRIAARRQQQAQKRRDQGHAQDFTAASPGLGVMEQVEGENRVQHIRLAHAVHGAEQDRIC